MGKPSMQSRFSHVDENNINKINRADAVNFENTSDKINKLQQVHSEVATGSFMKVHLNCNVLLKAFLCVPFLRVKKFLFFFVAEVHLKMSTTKSFEN